MGTYTRAVWQDSPVYGCDDNPSYKWFARVVADGHVVQFLGPFETEEQAETAGKEK